MLQQWKDSKISPQTAFIVLVIVLFLFVNGLLWWKWWKLDSYLSSAEAEIENKKTAIQTLTAKTNVQIPGQSKLNEVIFALPSKDDEPRWLSYLNKLSSRTGASMQQLTIDRTDADKILPDKLKQMVTQATFTGTLPQILSTMEGLQTGQRIVHIENWDMSAQIKGDVPQIKWQVKLVVYYAPDFFSPELELPPVIP